MTTTAKHLFLSRDLSMRAALLVFASIVLCLGSTRVHAAPQWAVAVFPTGEEFSLEVAADPQARALGYMYREKIGANEGMLFVFDEPGPYTFWMKNCIVSLDIIWLDADFRVIEIAHDQRPCPGVGECPSVGPMRAASYVIEVAAGTAKREGLEYGDRITILSESPLP